MPCVLPWRWTGEYRSGSYAVDVIKVSHDRMEELAMVAGPYSILRTTTTRHDSNRSVGHYFTVTESFGLDSPRFWPGHRLRGERRSRSSFGVAVSGDWKLPPKLQHGVGIVASANATISAGGHLAVEGKQPLPAALRVNSYAYLQQRPGMQAIVIWLPLTNATLSYQNKALDASRC